MNWFEHHIGDYDEATAHLSACEDGIYSRMIRKYYSTERPLIADLQRLQRLVRAKTKEEKDAVQTVLEEFFHLEDDGWHQKKCDEVLAAYIAGEPEREVKKANEDNRLRRHRDERARLFKEVTDAGEHAPWNIGINELRVMAERIRSGSDDNTATATGNAVPPLPATAPATPATATQPPPTITQPPEDKNKNPDPSRECEYCGVRQSQVDRAFERDHFIPKCVGGPDDDANRVWACHTCNQIKGARLFPSMDAAREAIHDTLWRKNRARYAVPRTLCFGGKPPAGFEPPLTKDDLVAEGVDPQVAADWLVARVAKRAPTLTQTAWDGVKREAQKAGLSVPAAVRVAAESSWVGFRADWFASRSRAGNNPGGGSSVDVFAGSL